MSLSAEEREELRATARSMLARRSSGRARAVVEDDEGFDAELWAQIVHLGWTAIHVEERYGGAECGYRDLIVILHELGARSCVRPVPSQLRASDRCLGRSGPRELSLGRSHRPSQWGRNRIGSPRGSRRQLRNR